MPCNPCFKIATQMQQKEKQIKKNKKERKKSQKNINYGEFQDH